MGVSNAKTITYTIRAKIAPIVILSPSELVELKKKDRSPLEMLSARRTPKTIARVEAIWMNLAIRGMNVRAISPLVWGVKRDMRGWTTDVRIIAPPSQDTIEKM